MLQGEVLTVAYDGNSAFNSTVTHLALTYTSTAPATAPQQLLLKRNLDAPWAVAAGAREAQFYQMVGRLSERLPMIVPCYDAAHDIETGNSHILLRDLSATHRAPLTRDQLLNFGSNMPPVHEIVAIVDTLAQFHGYWWEHSLLGTGVAQVGTWWQDQAHYANESQRREAAWAVLLESEQAWLPDQMKQLYEQALAGLPRLWERYHEPRLAGMHNMTLTHGDAYFTNFLCPNEGTLGETYLIDWQGPAVSRGADDLVNLLVTCWTPNQRAEGQREAKLLRRYHDGLCAQGVHGYLWADLLVDYRVAVIEWLFQPVQDRADGAGKDYWWPKLQYLAAAFQAWKCADLLK